MEKTQKIKQILNSVKLEVDDIEKFGKDVDMILDMFNEIKDVDVEGVSSNLNKKKITLEDLRPDEVKSWNFRPEMSGKYFKVPSVSKKK